MLRSSVLFIAALGLVAVACTASSEESIEGASADLTHLPTVMLSCDESAPDSGTPLHMTLDVRGAKLKVSDGAGTAVRSAIFDRDYQSRGTPKVRYNLDRRSAAFTPAEFEWNMIMIEQSTLSTGHGSATIRLDAGDRSEWRYVRCNAASAMPAACRAKVLDALGEGSVQSSATEILASLEADWLAHPQAATVNYNDCGSSDYFFVTVRKSDCEVIELEGGDSDGECQ